MSKRTGPRDVQRQRKLARRRRDRDYHGRWNRLVAPLDRISRQAISLGQMLQEMSIVIMPEKCEVTPVTFGLATAEARPGAWDHSMGGTVAASPPMKNDWPNPPLTPES